jgi:hypothetical protein
MIKHLNVNDYVFQDFKICVIIWIYEETLVFVFQTFQNQTTTSPSYFKTILKELAVFNLKNS